MHQTAAIEGKDSRMKGDNLDNQGKRAKSARNTILNVFIELIQMKPVDKITVTEICQLAQVNRSTFYKYFMDCYDVMEQLESAAINRFDQMLTKMSVGEKNPAILITSMLLFLRDNPDVKVFAAIREQNWQFLSRFVQHAYAQLEKWMGDGGNNPAMRTQAMAYIVQGSVGVIIQWMHSGMQEEPETITNALMILSKAVIDAV